jgi:integrase
MPRFSEPFTQHTVDQARPRGKRYDLRDGKVTGLILRVSKTGRKVWTVRLKDGRRFVLGPVEALTLKGARDRALAYIRHQGSPPELQVAPTDATPESEPNVLTLGRYLGEQYRPFFEAHHRDPKKHLHNFKAFPGLMDLPLTELTPVVLDGWVTNRLRTVMRATVRRNVAALKAALAQAHRWGLIAEHPLDRYSPVKRADEARTRYLSAPEEERLRAALARFRRPQFRALVLVALNTGMRRGELFSLKWDDVDLPGRLITVRAETTKSERTRHIPMSAECLQLLSALPRKEGNPYVFTGLRGKRLVNVGAQFKRLCVRAKLEDFSFHDLRHSFASNLVQVGVELYAVQRLLGHSDPKLTARYSHLAPDSLRAAIDRLRTT